MTVVKCSSNNTAMFSLGLCAVTAGIDVVQVPSVNRAWGCQADLEQRRGQRKETGRANRTQTVKIFEQFGICKMLTKANGSCGTWCLHGWVKCSCSSAIRR